MCFIRFLTKEFCKFIFMNILKQDKKHKRKPILKEQKKAVSNFISIIVEDEKMIRKREFIPLSSFCDGWFVFVCLLDFEHFFFQLNEWSRKTERWKCVLKNSLHFYGENETRSDFETEKESGNFCCIFADIRHSFRLFLPLLLSLLDR